MQPGAIQRWSLGDLEVRGIASEIVGEALQDFCERTPKALGAVLEKARAAAKAAEAAKAAKVRYI